MRASISVFILAILSLAALPAYGASVPDLTLVLDSSVGSGAPTGQNADADPPCLQPNCVLFTGTLTDLDFDPVNLNPMYLTDIGLSYTSDFSIDNTFFFEVPGVMSGDANYATDGLGAGPNIYSGPIFGIDIAPGTPAGVYEGTVTIFAVGGANDPDDLGFTVSEDITVDVTPEPAPATLLLAGLLAFAVWRIIQHKWPSSKASRS